MGRSPCCSKVGLRRGPWSTKEDNLLTNYIQEHGEGQWKALPTKAGLLRCGKSCRLRWMNYLRPGIKRGNISQDEEDLIVRLHRLLGNRWSLIAGRLPGRTDNEIKNYWNTSLLKKLKKAPHQDAAKGGAPDVEKKNHKVKVSGTAKANNNKKSDEEPEEINSNDPPKVYMPKAIRASSGFSSTSSNDSDGGEAVAKCRVIEEDDLLGMGSILPEIMSDDGSMWEKVFHEYLELL